MKHPLYQVTAFEIVAPFALQVSFSDGVTQLIDFQPILYGQLYGPLRDVTVFNQVALNPEIHTLEWPNGADFDPATLHDWTDHLAGLKALARKWALAEAEDEWVAVQRVQEALKTFGPFESLATLAKQSGTPLSTLAQAAREGRLPAIPVAHGWLARSSAVPKRKRGIPLRPKKNKTKLITPKVRS